MKVSRNSFFGRLRKFRLDTAVSHSLQIRVLGMLIIYLSQVVLARLMNVKAFGDYTVITTLLNFLLVISLFGTDTSILRFIPSALRRREFGEIRGFLKFTARTILLLSLMCSTGLFIYILFTAKKLNNISFAEGVFWAVLLLPFLAWIHQSSAILRAFRKVRISLLGIYILLPVSLTFFCYYYYSEHEKLNVDAAMLINMLCTAGVAFVFGKIAQKTVKRETGGTGPVITSSLWKAVSATLLVTTLLNLFLRQSDILFVSHLVSNTKAGIYGVAVKLSSLVALGLSVIDYVYMPKIAAMWESGDRRRLNEMIRYASRQILLLTVPVVILFILLGKTILGFFGNPFNAAFVPLLILTAGQFVNALTGMVGGLLVMTGNQNRFLLFYLISALVQVLLMYSLVPVWGITGAAVASASALILLNIMGYFYVRAGLKIQASVF
ncbi:MAG: polysaccharide biosynthesis C-terminal domain-containing protein [Bacteroidia bacterium]|nr:polysaccharide biosynthesis C-terminal domain-containing protein [Bacteroidia bacterium]